MNKEQNNDLYDFDTQCTLCVCVPGNHLKFFSCPILENNPISTDCCLIGCLKNDAAEKFSKATGKEITLEQMNEICKQCGQNYGVQNEELAKKLEREN